MDPSHADQGWEDTHSHPARSRTSSNVSTTEGLFRHLQLAGSPAASTSYAASRPSSQGLASPGYISNVQPTYGTYLPTPVSQTSSPFPLVSEEVLDADWFETPEPQAHARTHGTPLLRVDPAEDYQLGTPSSSPLVPTSPATMSAVAVQFDPGFNMTARSSSFTWPLIESGSGLLGHNLSAYASDASLTPPSGSRSVTASPPRSIFTADHRSLRHQNQARRDTKMAMRTQRAGSGSSFASDTPVTVADLTTGTASLPIYTTAPSQISLLTEPPTTLAPPQFLSSYAPDQGQAGLFPNPYQQTYLPVDYSSYPPTSASNLAAQYGATLPVQDPNTMYSVPPSVMGAGGSTGQRSLPGSVPAPDGNAAHVRLVHTRPKPQCWDHGCNGRQFSTFSNLLRHQREKNGQATKATCPNCGAGFTRTTARNGHLAHDKCKVKRNSAGSIN